MTDPLSERVANLSPAKLRLLMKHMARQRGVEVAEPPALERRSGDGPVPLSFSQQRLWFLDQLEPGSTAYALPSALRLEGALDHAALAAALARVVERHEVLRATFEEREGEPVQVFHRPGGHAASRVRLPLVDLSSLDRDRAAGETLDLARRDARRPFDLARGPLFRNVLVRLGEEEHALLQNLHHVVSDGWSRPILVREMARAYDAFRQGRRPDLPALEVGYGDYCEWQRRWLEGATLDEMVEFWRQRLAGAPPEVTLPPDRPRPRERTGAGAVAEAPLPAGLVDRLEEVGRRHGSTLFMTLVAALGVLFQRYGAGDDVVLGTPVANRQDRRLEGVIGFFVNNLVLRLDLSGEPTFGELLGRVRETALAGYAHQDLPFEKLVEELAPERAPGRQPLFQGMFMLENVPSGRLELADLAFEPLAADSGAAKFDWIFAIEGAGDGDGWRLRVEYSRELYDAATVKRWMDHYRRLLEGAVANPGARLGDLPLLSATEEKRLLEEWNRRPAPAPHRPSLVDLFAERAQERPEAVALRHRGRSTSYGELARGVWRLAHRLGRAGVRRGSRVALLLEPSVTQVEAVLAVLAAGGAYVPLDPAAPPERLAGTVADAAPSLLLTVGDLARPLLERLAAAGGTAPRVLDPEGEAEGSGAAVEARRPVVPGLGGDDLAYVIYTSGSTGRPKGVGVHHACVVRLLEATDPWFGFGPDDVWTLFHSYAFDFSVWELWGALARGGRLVLVDRSVTRSPAAFHHLLREEGVTVLNQTPSAFRQLVAADGEAGEEARRELVLRLVVFGGEALDPAALAPWVEAHGDAAPRLVNMYGITETTVHVTYRRVTAAAVDRAVAGATESAVGVPIPDLQVHLLGRRGARGPVDLVPVGVPGEIHVGGEGLARGYLGRPALTAARFVPDPFSPLPGARLYRSGDLARRQADGTLVYLGRIDHQVQVRGFRVELGEIEAVLDGHPAVAEAVVLALDGSEGPRLTAFVVPAVEAAAEAPLEAIRAHLAARLPDYMIPGAFAVIDAVPLNRNGKVDRAALAALETTRLGLGRERVAPRTALEERLVVLWSEILEVDAGQVGVEHNFFHLGGHSLLATRLVARLRRETGVDLPLAVFFEGPTVAELAEALEMARWAASGADPAAAPGDSGGEGGEEMEEGVL